MLQKMSEINCNTLLADWSVICVTYSQQSIAIAICLYNLILCIFFRHGIRSIRDLTAEHLPLLRNLLHNGLVCASISFSFLFVSHTGNTWICMRFYLTACKLNAQPILSLCASFPVYFFSSLVQRYHGVIVKLYDTRLVLAWFQSIDASLGSEC